MKILVAVLILASPAAVAQEQPLSLQCNYTHCMVPITVLEQLLENCGPLR